MVNSIDPYSSPNLVNALLRVKIIEEHLSELKEAIDILIHYIEEQDTVEQYRAEAEVQRLINNFK